MVNVAVVVFVIVCFLSPLRIVVKMTRRRDLTIRFSPHAPIVGAVTKITELWHLAMSRQFF